MAFGIWSWPFAGIGYVWEIGSGSRMNLIIIHLKSSQNYFFLALPDSILSRPVKREQLGLECPSDKERSSGSEPHADPHAT